MMLCGASLASAIAAGARLELSRSAAPPDLKITVTSPGVYRAVVWQQSGGGIMEFYNLAADPGATVNLAKDTAGRGLFEIGWHGNEFKSPPGKDHCCTKHVLEAKPGKAKEGTCYDGCRDWPSLGHKELKAEGQLDVIEQGPARVRVRAASWFTWWSKYADKDLPVEAIYTFYPSGRIVVQVHVRRLGDAPMHWSTEYGPHLMFPSHDKQPDADAGFTWSTPKCKRYDLAPSGPEELLLAVSEKAKTSFMLAIPAEEERIFDRYMRHNGRSIGFDRSGWGSHGIIMEPGYDNTWAAMIQMGASGNGLAPEMKTAADALPLALQYRNPPKLAVKGGVLVLDDPGDLNKDGFNESEGCYVLRGEGPMELTCPRESVLHQPAFKFVGCKGSLPEKVTLDGVDAAFVADSASGDVVIQLLATVRAGTKVVIGK
jgi:hypothetical protein